jgi:hypothetical protein
MSNRPYPFSSLSGAPTIKFHHDASDVKGSARPDVEVGDAAGARSRLPAQSTFAIRTSGTATPPRSSLSVSTGA